MGEPPSSEERRQAAMFPFSRRKIGRSRSSDEPSSLVDVEFHQTFIAHFQKQGLASFLIREIGASHDFVDLERLLSERLQDILAIVQHDNLRKPKNT
jgi:phosphopantetheine adenylyltransferase